ncbi:MAG: hypothetical protein CK425_03070 [Parachlamydia sp.]|nr:MAG: hypothetical protein CK425_03070 [Parachlamydia sp.]
MSSNSYSLAVDLSKQDEISVEDTVFEPTLNLIINTQYQKSLSPAEFATNHIAKIEGRLTVSF